MVSYLKVAKQRWTVISLIASLLMAKFKYQKRLYLTKIFT